MKQLDLFEYEPIEPPMRMVLDTVNVEIAGKDPDQARQAIYEAQSSLPEGSKDAVLRISGGPDDLHQTCRIQFRRPQTEEEKASDLRYLPVRLKAVAA